MHHLIRNWIKSNPDSFDKNYVRIPKGTNYYVKDKKKILKHDIVYRYSSFIRFMNIYNKKLYVIKNIIKNNRYVTLYISIDNAIIEEYKPTKPIYDYPLVRNRYTYTDGVEKVKIIHKDKENVILNNGDTISKILFRKKYKLVMKEKFFNKSIKFKNNDFPITIDDIEFRNSYNFISIKSSNIEDMCRSSTYYFPIIHSLIRNGYDISNLEIGTYNKFTGELICVKDITNYKMYFIMKKVIFSRVCKKLIKEEHKSMTWNYGFFIEKRKIYLLKTLNDFCKFKLKKGDKIKMFKTSEILSLMNSPIDNFKKQLYMSFSEALNQK